VAFLEARKALVDVFQRAFDGGALRGERAHFEVFFHAHLQKDPSAFRHVRNTAGDDFMGSYGLDALAFKRNVPGFCAQQARHRFEDGGLARAVCAD
jgi:hypothetical protein